MRFRAGKFTKMLSAPHSSGKASSTPDSTAGLRGAYTQGERREGAREKVRRGRGEGRVYGMGRGGGGRAIFRDLRDKNPEMMA